MCIHLTLCHFVQKVTLQMAGFGHGQLLLGGKLCQMMPASCVSHIHNGTQFFDTILWFWVRSGTVLSRRYFTAIWQIRIIFWSVSRFVTVAWLIIHMVDKRTKIFTREFTWPTNNRLQYRKWMHLYSRVCCSQLLSDGLVHCPRSWQIMSPWSQDRCTTEGGCKLPHVRSSSLGLISDSYQLMILGSLLQSLSLFALSFAKPGQFYMVSVPTGFIGGLLIFVTRFLYFRASFLGLGWA
jgi:hypothetical protein